MTFIIRPANAGDAASIVELVHGLAAYEQYAERVLLRADHLAEQLNPALPHPKLYACIATDGRDSLGFAMGFPCFSTYLGGWYFYLSDLYVREQSRHQKVGSALLRRMAQLAHEHHFGSLALDVLRRNTQAVRFYQRHGGVPHDTAATMWFEGEAFDRLAASANQ